MVSVAIVGVSGYGGGELVRLLARHPEVRLAHVVSETYAGQPLSRAFRGLSGTPAGKLICESFRIGSTAKAADVIFLAQENGAAMKSAPEFLNLGKRIIDLSADFRLRDIDAYEKWYKMEHVSGGLMSEAVYGLPEMNRTLIQGARLVANPGCYPTASVLPLLPLLSEGLIDSHGIIIDAKSGVSGAGRSKFGLDYHYAEANESMKPYGVGGVHRHVPEIEQELSSVVPGRVTVTFTPHLAPMSRGILATSYSRRVGDVTTEKVVECLKSAYADEPFVIVRDAGDYPATKDVSGSNFCHIAAKVDSRTGQVILMSVIDNLVKGAAGQAVQNMNLMLGLPETTGLEGAGLWP